MQHNQNQQYGEDQFEDEYDVYQSASRPSKGDPILEETNFGMGNYDDDAFWQQVRSYRKGKVAELSFGGIMRAWALHETQARLAMEGFNYYDEESMEPKHWKAWADLSEDEREDYGSVLAYGASIWRDMEETNEALSGKQRVALEKKAGYTGDWRPLFYRMAQFRHEASRSRGGRLLDNLLTHVSSLRGDAEDIQDLFTGGS